ncbi:hypothetical protein hmeg3_23470 [Herbaspirillum sp. meg3]|uniref:alpha/beta hydrolase n=1 Tax=Herbaspirillum sp. meg3 TaxID=2025949 RepID=UPI000B997A69|nr:PHB depolymerase family esterase [Herbaspirillum sp. meg3]ASU40968.1 hypothetical protein hmeg3_23470 [Herbaspirillum sp. meg3]
MTASSNSSEGHGLPLHHLVRRPAAGAIAGEGGSACLLLLHGVGSNETNLAGFAQAQDPRLTVILPRGPLAFGPNQHGWFNVNFTATGPVIDPAQAEASRNVLVSFIEGLPAAYGIAPGKVWIAGFSQGGIMSAGVGLTRPDKAAGFGILSGRILPEIAPLTAGDDALRKSSAYVSHGVQDNKLTVEYARNARRLLNEHQIPTVYREYTAGHELNAEMQGDFIAWMTQQLDAASGY